MSFKKDGYIIIRKAIDPKIADFIHRYFLLKKRVARTLFDKKYISPFTSYWGVWNDSQAPETYSHYADTAAETLLSDLKDLMEEKTELKLFPTYSYTRVYKNGDVLERHKDRFSCEISTTLNMGGDRWPIFIEPDKNKGHDTEDGYVSEFTSGIKVDLEPGDMLVYRGTDLEHWREKFNGTDCCQVFLHYNIDSKDNKNKYDGREHLGLPCDLKNNRL
tara:strand:+ start:174 stop:827 length:654 start_codon:yes stop_codon:yes gene_type:complete